MSKSAKIDTTRAHPARRYDYLLGGKDNFAADRESGDQLVKAMPTIRTAALENRGFMRRVVTHLVAECGLRQFLDIGTGIPTAPNVHQIAQGIAPESRIVYVDNDPIVLAHARALLTSSPEGATAYVDADVREPQKILTAPELLSTIDLGKPVALMMVAVMHFVPDDTDPYGIVRTLVEALPSGSYLALSHVTWDLLPPNVVAALTGETARTKEPFRARARDEVARFFTGLDMLSPGIVCAAEWRAENEPEPRPSAAEVSIHAAVARIP